MPDETITAGTPSAGLSAADGLAQLSFLVQSVLQRLAAECGISIVQMRLLGILRDRAPTMKQLASLLGLDKSSTTGLVDRAEHRGLVVREPSKVDRRSARVRLTDGGRLLVAEVADRFDAEISAMLGGLPARDQRTLSKLVSRLVVAQASSRGVDLFANLRAQQQASAAQPAYVDQRPPKRRDSSGGV